ncbi:translation initiation factor IF-2-like [Manacus candei]|uniref:translation initiation factor IF-2-like n=1 Tax=Manacus candei TaxID=415023 RepID=UPI002226A7C8|nr:translation initiation factor IF-2-like [Manacus candei]
MVGSRAGGICPSAPSAETPLQSCLQPWATAAQGRGAAAESPEEAPEMLPGLEPLCSGARLGELGVLSWGREGSRETLEPLPEPKGAPGEPPAAPALPPVGWAEEGKSRGKKKAGARSGELRKQRKTGRAGRAKEGLQPLIPLRGRCAAAPSAAEPWVVRRLLGKAPAVSRPLLDIVPSGHLCQLCPLPTSLPSPGKWALEAPVPLRGCNRDQSAAGGEVSSGREGNPGRKRTKCPPRAGAGAGGARSAPHAPGAALLPEERRGAQAAPAAPGGPQHPRSCLRGAQPPDPAWGWGCPGRAGSAPPVAGHGLQREGAPSLASPQP